MTVQELNKEELEELKFNHFYSEDVDLDDYNYPDEIPNSVIFKHYEDTYFVEEDFFCNL